MDCVVDADIRSLAKMNTVATLLPGANYFLGSEAVSTGKEADRFGRGRCAGDGLQPGHIADGEYAVRLIPGVHANEDVSG